MQTQRQPHAVELNGCTDTMLCGESSMSQFTEPNQTIPNRTEAEENNNNI